MKKVGYFFLCFLPLMISLLLQFVLIVPAMGIAVMQLCSFAVLSGEKLDFQTFYQQLLSTVSGQTFTTGVSLAFAILGILIYGFWYSRQFHGNLTESPKSFANLPVLLGIACLVPGLQFMSSILTSLTASIFPNALEFYEKLMESSGLTGSPSLLLLLYAVLLGPIEEELAFRGVILSSAKKVFPFWAANILQALLFGIFHMNLIQGIYAFFIGLFLGYVCEKGGSIYLSIFLHILFNTWGTLILPNNPLMTNPIFVAGFFVVSVFFGILGLTLFQKNVVKKD